MSIFKSCDIRGIYDADLDKETAYRLGRAVGSRLAGIKIVVGGDLRISTPALKSSLIDGLCDSGAHVIDLGLIPTPALYYGKRRMQAQASIMVTASHNPPEYNGFKLMLSDLPLEPKALQELAREMQRGDFLCERGERSQESILNDYAAYLDETFEKPSPRRMVIDAGNGSMGTVAPTPAGRPAGWTAMDTVPAYPITPDIRLPCPPQMAQRIIDQLKAAFSDHPLNTLDGVRVQFPNGWALARVSVTEPAITLRFEAKSKRALTTIQKCVGEASPLLRQVMADAER